jgi:hypothetical protein
MFFHMQMPKRIWPRSRTVISTDWEEEGRKGEVGFGQCTPYPFTGIPHRTPLV